MNELFIRKIRLKIILYFILIIMCTNVFGQMSANKDKGTSYPFILNLPKKYNDSSDVKWPVLLFCMAGAYQEKTWN